MDTDRAARLLEAFDRIRMEYDPPLEERVPQSRGSAHAVAGVPPKPDATVSQRFVVAPDPQFPRLDSDHVAESASEILQAQATLRAHFASISTYRKAYGDGAPIPVFINGDIVETGEPDRLTFSYNLINDLGAATYVGLGNHDCDLPPYLLHEERMVRSCVRHVEFLKKAGVALDVHESGSTDPFWQMYEGSLGYVVDHGDLRSIQLNLYPWFTRTLKAYLAERLETKEFKIHPSLEWLEQRLIEARVAKKDVILHLHYVPEGDAATPFLDTCERFGIKAIFHGHRHTLRATVQRKVSYYVCGAGFYRSFVVGEYDRGKHYLAVYFAENGEVSRAKDYGVSLIPDVAVPKVASIERQIGRAIVNLESLPLQVWQTDVVWYIDNVPMAPQTYQRGEVIRYETLGPGRNCRVRLMFRDYGGHVGAWSAIYPVPAYDGPMPAIPKNLRVAFGSTLRDCELTWDPVDKAHGYVVKVGKGTDHLGAIVLTSLPPNCYERTETMLTGLRDPIATYRGMNIKVMTTTHDNVWSTPGLLPIDPILDHYVKPAGTQEADTQREALRAERESLLERLVDIESTLAGLDQ